MPSSVIEAALVAQVEKWQTALAAYREAAQAQAVIESSLPPTPQPAAPATSLKARIEHILAGSDLRRENREIVKAINAHGRKYSDASIAAALHRLKLDGRLLRFPNGWDLAARYPETMRAQFGASRPRRRRHRVHVPPVVPTEAMQAHANV